MNELNEITKQQELYHAVACKLAAAHKKLHESRVKATCYCCNEPCECELEVTKDEVLQYSEQVKELIDRLDELEYSCPCKECCQGVESPIVGSTQDHISGQTKFYPSSSRHFGGPKGDMQRVDWDAHAKRSAQMSDEECELWVNHLTLMERIGI